MKVWRTEPIDGESVDGEPVVPEAVESDSDARAEVPVHSAYVRAAVEAAECAHDSHGVDYLGRRAS